jgi:hypothetical protein
MLLDTKYQQSLSAARDIIKRTRKIFKVSSLGHILFEEYR